MRTVKWVHPSGGYNLIVVRHIKSVRSPLFLSDEKAWMIRIAYINSTSDELRFTDLTKANDFMSEIVHAIDHDGET